MPDKYHVCWHDTESYNSLDPPHINCTTNFSHDLGARLNVLEGSK